ncbi:extracellular solute-binding protein [Paenibacillus doosanensis]|uniref:extracellular solute-binding protein n=1 Tax=Paenibacillus doosanensis TaxID=1229154 RepID=UPI00217FD685|nr:extracellular solute-binding protein [Paenibacillus doosanensis]MCS7464914.1 extracellular solute-binding protein [Paenibacillus doosanensis]
MSNKRKKQLAAAAAVMMAAVSLAGCGGSGASQGEGAAADGGGGPVKIKVYKTHLGKGTMPDSSNAHVQYIAQKTGVEYVLTTSPPGADPAESINVMIASGDLPDIMRPIGGVEQTLIQQGGALALDDLLPKYAPNVWNSIPKEAWDVVRTASPDGKIYYVPKVYMIPERVPMIRKDWMDKLNLTMPATKDEYVTLLKAFKDQDPNGNGKADEIPTTGREFGTWMDHLFAMYGVAMWEGKPEWDVYDGNINYAGTSQNMKAAIAFLRELYAQKLLDNETFLNKGDVWQAKINNNLVGNWYHLPASLKDKIDAMRKTAPDAYVAGLPLPKVDGFTGFITQKSIGEAEWIIPKAAEKRAQYALKLLDFFYDPANQEFNLFGVEGLQHEVVDGKKKLLPQTDDKPIALGMLNFTTKESMDKRLDQLYTADQAKMIKDIFAVGMKDARRIAGDGMPSSVYEGFPDIQSHKMFQEYLAKIVIGEWPLEKFDEFVQKWKQSGGDEVTKRAQEWYAKVQSFNKK